MLEVCTSAHVIQTIIHTSSSQTSTVWVFIIHKSLLLLLSLSLSIFMWLSAGRAHILPEQLQAFLTSTWTLRRVCEKQTEAHLKSNSSTIGYGYIHIIHSTKQGCRKSYIGNSMSKTVLINYWRIQACIYIKNIYIYVHFNGKHCGQVTNKK